jgi:hypothetical protein
LEQNPYQPPTAALEEPGSAVRPVVGWRLYSGFLVLTLASYPILGIDWLQELDVLDVLIGTTSLIGLCGYAFQRRIGASRFWQRWLPVAVVWDVLYELVLTPLGIAGQYPGAEPLEFFELAIVAALVITLYVGLYRYGSRSEALWSAARSAR